MAFRQTQPLAHRRGLLSWPQRRGKKGLWLELGELQLWPQGRERKGLWLEQVELRLWLWLWLEQVELRLWPLGREESLY